jgi:hypothetical protein
VGADAAEAAAAGSSSRRCRRGASPFGFEHQDRRALVDLVAHGHLERLDDAGMRRRDLHRRLVALDRDQRLLGLDGVARLDEQLDHRHVLEIADVGNLDFDRGHARHLLSLIVCSRTGAAEFLSNSQPAATPMRASSRRAAPCVDRRMHGAKRERAARADGPEAVELEHLAVRVHAEHAARVGDQHVNWLLS